jgi:hypothetical protein
MEKMSRHERSTRALLVVLAAVPLAACGTSSAAGSATSPDPAPHHARTLVDPPAVIPEAPLAIGLPLVGVAVVGGSFALSSRRRRAEAARPTEEKG